MGRVLTEMSVTKSDLLHMVDTDTEALVLGTVLRTGESAFREISFLSVDDFSVEKHRLIFRTMRDLASEVHPTIDAVSLRLQEMGEIGAVGGFTGLTDLDAAGIRGMPLSGFARDGGADLIGAQGAWILETFRRALGGEEDSVHRTRSGLQYNPIAIAFVGTVLLLRNRFEMTDVSALLETAGSGNPAAAQGFAAGLLAVINEALPRALLRGGFCGCIHPERRWDMPEEDYKARLEVRRQEARAAIDAEIAWLEGKQNEPAWPAFETLKADSRHHSFSARRALREERETEARTVRRSSGGGSLARQSRKYIQRGEKAMAARRHQGLFQLDRSGQWCGVGAG
jgi:hypothetical protein